jgi:hypothetical protein
MVFHCHSETRSALVEDISEINQRRSEGNCIHSEDSEDVELNREYLICSNNFNGDFHSEFFIFIFRRSLIVLLYQIFLAV